MADSAPPPTAPWQEPNAQLPLRWGDYGRRQLVGSVLLVVGALLIVQTNAYTAVFGWLGSAIHILGWAVLPARGGRRVLAAPLSMLAFWFMLLGSSLTWLASISLALWLLVRRRPGITYVLVPLPALSAIVSLVLLGPFAPRLALFGLVLAVTIACAWAARAIAVRERRPSRGIHPGETGS